jgi:hypothetical protein
MGLGYQLMPIYWSNYYLKPQLVAVEPVEYQLGQKIYLLFEDFVTYWYR